MRCASASPGRRDGLEHGDDRRESGGRLFVVRSVGLAVLTGRVERVEMDSKAVRGTTSYQGDNNVAQ